MFEYFNDKAIKSVMLAQEEARRTGHNVVGTEHLLLGIIGEGTASAAKLLMDLGINLQKTRRTIEETTGRGPGYSPPNIPFTPKVKRLFEQSFQEARKLGHQVVSPEHLLLAITAEPESLAAKILILQGVNLLELRSQLLAEGKEKATAAVGAGNDPYKMGSSAKTTNKMAEFSINLTELAKEGKLDPVVGRSQEIERSIQILGRRTKNNPVLVGEPGVGKTAIAEGLAQLIIEGDVPELLKDKQVISLDLGLLVAGTRFRGEFEERLQAIVQEVREAGNIILVIDELHTLVGAGALGGSLDAANMIKPALARGELQCLGATTLDEYRQYIERDAALERRFQPVMVGEPSVEETIEILTGLRKNYEEYHNVKISDLALAAAAKLADRYINDRFLPDKAIDLIDEAGSRTHIKYCLSKKTHPETNQEESPIINPDSLIPVVDEEDIATIVSSWTGVPLNKVNQDESDNLIHLETRLHERIIGQDEAVKAVAKAVRRARVGINDPRRPIASFIFAGPTGVGKTELAKALANFLFGAGDAMIRLDMSEFMESHTVSKLIGSPPGFIGYEEGGQLTEAVRRKPYTVVLFDEIEKAHPDVFNLLLQLLDDGHLTDAKGRKVSFKNTLIIMTSNIGSKIIEKGGSGLGFAMVDNQAEAQYNYLRNLVNEEMKQYFRPEFLNRLDELIVFRQLNQAEIKDIAEILLQEVAKQLKEQRNITLGVTESFKTLVSREGYDPSYGARPLRRAIMRRLEDSLAEAILSGQVEDESTLLVDVDEQGTVKVLSDQESILQLQPVG
jgi:ATP-dependent Clp protease ATP-binding subunit ClpC